MKSNISKSSYCRYYIQVTNNDKSKYLAFDRNNNYCLMPNILNSRCIKFDNYTFAKNWFNYNHHLFNHILTANSKIKIIDIGDIK